MQLTGFKGRTAVVTGAAGGIGLALVTLLRAAGSLVVATDLTAALADKQDEDGLSWQALDVSDASATETLFAKATRDFGPIGLVIHAAGTLSNMPILQTTPQEWSRVSRINNDGTFHVLRTAGQAMCPQRKGAIVVIGSNAGGIPRHRMASYAASKAAAAMLTRCAGLELAEFGIRCNLVAPGSTLTPMQTGMWADERGAEKVIAGDLATFRTGIPLGKLATPVDIAQAAMFLLSDQAGHITMADLYVDGGATLRA
ncbi:SDR family oxidoreductase [Paracoccus sp. Z330]|uniref:SDR family oxidoreductase n=1 Tax=Paracoccus onchidii TaxID=3017813 RepID=A0ABT4ZAT8_9RHOB|nr:SDR family oxidoreductase [Paracoccus onchidii]MDB6176382.1 SDR family oxidoreductase [Paracoccus onchidii]